jgi:hypothetical protein
MEEMWILQDMAREAKRQKLRRKFDPDVSTEAFIKHILKQNEREEKWKVQDTERIKRRIEFRKKHPISEKVDRRWLALTHN